MLTVVEKVILLQDVEIFSEVSTEQLAYVAGIAEEETFAAEHTIYREQDPSDSMYMVVDGRVRLHRGDMEITVAGAGHTFGNSALFDDELRVSTATTLEETRVLRIDKEEFIDLLADNVQITQGLLKALVNQVRGLIGRVGAGGSQ